MYAQQPGWCDLKFFYFWKTTVTADNLQVLISAADAYIDVVGHSPPTNERVITAGDETKGKNMTSALRSFQTEKVYDKNESHFWKTKSIKIGFESPGPF